MSGITIQIMGDGAGAAEALRVIEERMAQTAEKGKMMSEALATAGETVRTSLETMGLGLSIGFVVDGFKEMVKSTMEAAEQIGHLSQQTGISAQNLSVLKYAAQSTGVDFEVLTRGFKKLAVTTYSADTGNKAAAKGFAQLGISMADLRAKGDDMYGVLGLVAEKIAALPAGITRSDAAAKIFGARMGSEMIPVLITLAGKTDELKTQAEALGVVWDEKGIKKMEALHKSSADLQAALSGLAMKLVVEVGPALKDIAAGAEYVTSKFIGMMKAVNGADLAAQAERAAQIAKSIPNQIEGLGSNAASGVATEADKKKAALEREIDVLEGQRARKLILEETYQKQKAAIVQKWNESDLLENQAYFTALQDQITSAHDTIARLNTNKPTAATFAAVDAEQAKLTQLLQEQARVMDVIESANDQLKKPDPIPKEGDLEHAKVAMATYMDFLIHGWANVTRAIVADETTIKQAIVQQAQQTAWDQMNKTDLSTPWAQTKQPTVGYEAAPVFTSNQDSDATKLKTEEARQAAQTIGGFMNQLTEQALKGKLSFKSLADSAISDLERFAMKVLEERALIPLLNAMFGLGGNSAALMAGASSAGGGANLAAGGLSSMFAGAFASGGDIDHGWAVVGDGGDGSGSELFAPKGPGTVLPHDVLDGLTKSGGGGGAPSVTVHTINNSSNPVKQSTASVDYDAQARQFVIHTILDDMHEGGPMASALQGFAPR